MLIQHGMGVSTGSLSDMCSYFGFSCDFFLPFFLWLQLLQKERSVLCESGLRKGIIK